MRSAVVLAGGYSTRFGEQDKALAQLDGEPLISRVVDSIDGAVEEVIVNCRNEQREALADILPDDVRFAIDRVPDSGPVAGIRDGCRMARGDWTFITACDMPFLETDVIEPLFEHADDDGAVPRVEGHPVPLAAVYDTTVAVESADLTLQTGSKAVMEFLAKLSPVFVADSVPPQAIEDIDTQAELRTARSRSA
jgi:molybdopterin-guanine dinucleotide biosynthesis protein A